MEKIKKTLYATFLIMTFLIGFAFLLAGNAKTTHKANTLNTQQKEYAAKITEDTNTKTLVVYFSKSGNTRYIAQKIQSKLDADIFELETATPYPVNSDETNIIAKNEIENNVLPELKQNINITAYDKVFVGTPVWLHNMAPAVKSFLSNNNFTGKTIIPFITHGGGGEYNIAKEMGDCAKGSRVLKSISIYGNGNPNTDSEIDNWLKEIGIF